MLLDFSDNGGNDIHDARVCCEEVGGWMDLQHINHQSQMTQTMRCFLALFAIPMAHIYADVPDFVANTTSSCLVNDDLADAIIVSPFLSCAACSDDMAEHQTRRLDDESHPLRT